MKSCKRARPKQVYKINGLECTDEEMIWMLENWGLMGTAQEFDVTPKAILYHLGKRGIKRRSA